jgi:hypothetical protein
MKLYTYQGPPGGPAAGSGELPPLAPGVSSVRFGNETLLYVEADREPDGAFPTGGAAAPATRGARLPQRQEDVRRDELHVVVQNGRLFQQHHPDVPVLHDRGRFLLVKLSPERVRELTTGQETCFGIMPLSEGQVVFEARQAAPMRAPAAFVQHLVDSVDPARLRPSLERLVAFGTRHSAASGFTEASRWAQAQLAELGYRTRGQQVAVSGGTSRNVIAERAGHGAGNRRIVLITAHLDSINLEGDPSAAAPGADDNGSGSAGLLEIARVLRAHRSEGDLRFILFGGEEQGLLGSKRYVASLGKRGRSRIIAIVNMDMVASLNAATRSVLLEGAPVSESVMGKLGSAAATFTHLHVETSLHPFASDHVPFIDAGLPAVLTIEGADNTNANIHSGRDTLAHVNAEFAAEILRMIVGFVGQEIGQAP